MAFNSNRAGLAAFSAAPSHLLRLLFRAAQPGKREMASRLRATLLLAACLLAGRAWAMEMMPGARAAGFAGWLAYRCRRAAADDDCWRVAIMAARRSCCSSCLQPMHGVLLPRLGIQLMDSCCRAQAVRWPPPLLAAWTWLWDAAAAT